ncbi:unnamed protein product, partial [Musa textilis]
PLFLPYSSSSLQPPYPVQWGHFEGFRLSKKVGELKNQASS